MRKHILGFALFNFIFASFALVYAFFYAPSLPPKEAVKPPVAQTEVSEERRSYCRMNSNKLSYEFQSSQFFLDENKVVSKIKITWNGYTKAPEKVYLNSDFFIFNDGIQYLFDDKQVLDEPFKESNEYIVTIISKVQVDKKVDEKVNLYAFFNVSQSLPIGKAQRSSADAHQVLFVHGESSVIKNTIPRSQ